jgi:AraC-like DNA-binding protein
MFRSDDALVPLLPVYRFADKAARSEGIEDLGAQAGLRASAFDLGSYGARLRECVTVHDYVRTGIRLIDTVTSGQHFWLTREADRLRFHQRISGEGEPGHAQADLFTLSVTLRMLKGFLGGGWRPEEIGLHAVHERCPPALEALTGGRLIMGCSHSSFVIQREVLERPLSRDLDESGGENRPGILPIPEMPGDFVSGMHRLTESLLAAGDCRIETAAEAAGMSVRSLQRHLGATGMTYRGIVNSTRIQLASRWLASTERPVIDIALTLGYEDPSNFTRAFRHRAGMSPTQYRNRSRSGSGARNGITAETGA